MLLLWYLLSPHFESAILSARILFLKCSSNPVPLGFNIPFWLSTAFWILKLSIPGLLEYGLHFLFLSSHWIHNLYSNQARLFALPQSSSLPPSGGPVQLIHPLGTSFPHLCPRKCSDPSKRGSVPFCEVFTYPPSQKPLRFSSILSCIMFLMYWPMPCLRFVTCEGKPYDVFTCMSPPVPAGVSCIQLVFPRQLCSGKRWPRLGQILFNVVWLIWSCSQLPNSLPSSLMIQKRCHFCVPTFLLNLRRHLKTHTAVWFREGNGPGVSLQQYII